MAQPARLELFERIESVVRAELRAIRQDDHNREAGLVYVEAKRVKHARGKGHTGYNPDEYGQTHIRGGLSERSAYGIMGPDVTACRKALRAIGVTLSVAECEGVMRQFQAIEDGTIQAHRGAGSSQAAKRTKNAAKMRARREKAREAGLCGICTARPVLPGMRNCVRCVRAEAERRKRRLQSGSH